MKKRTDGVCIGVCEFEKTGKIKQIDGVKKEEKKCVACGFKGWMRIKEKDE